MSCVSQTALAGILADIGASFRNNTSRWEASCLSQICLSGFQTTEPSWGVQGSVVGREEMILVEEFKIRGIFPN